MGGPARERKWSLVLFTLLVQAAAGLTWVLAWVRFLAPDVMEPAAALGFVVVLGMLGLGVAAAVLHGQRVITARINSVRHCERGVAHRLHPVRDHRGALARVVQTKHDADRIRRPVASRPTSSTRGTPCP